MDMMFFLRKTAYTKRPIRCNTGFVLDFSYCFRGDGNGSNPIGGVYKR